MPLLGPAAVGFAVWGKRRLVQCGSSVGLDALNLSIAVGVVETALVVFAVVVVISGHASFPPLPR
jgi:hypothetical protein